MRHLRILIAVSLVISASGAAIVVLALVPGGLDALVRASAIGDTDASVVPAVRFGVGIAGAVMAGWGVTLFVLGRCMRAGPVDRPRLGAAVLAGLASWFALDCAISIASGFGWNVLVNVAFLALAAWPALGLRAAARERS